MVVFSVDCSKIILKTRSSQDALIWLNVPYKNFLLTGNPLFLASCHVAGQNPCLQFFMSKNFPLSWRVMYGRFSGIMAVLWNTFHLEHPKLVLKENRLFSCQEIIISHSFSETHWNNIWKKPFRAFSLHPLIGRHSSLLYDIYSLIQLKFVYRAFTTVLLLKRAQWTGLKNMRKKLQGSTWRTCTWRKFASIIALGLASARVCIWGYSKRMPAKSLNSKGAYGHL